MGRGLSRQRQPRCSGIVDFSLKIITGSLGPATEVLSRHNGFLPHGDRQGKTRRFQQVASDLEARIATHRAGRGARLIEVVTAAGIGFVIARTWAGGRDLERRLKNRKNSPRLCPICRRARKEA